MVPWVEEFFILILNGPLSRRELNDLDRTMSEFDVEMTKTNNLELSIQ